MAPTTVYLGLGSNLGDRAAFLAAAVEGLGRFITVEALSDVYESDPVGYTDQPRFWNLAVRGRTGLAPDELLEAVQRVEREVGRTPTFRMGPREVDIDVLLQGPVSIARPGLTVPHPALLDRPFVLRPLLDLDPHLRHPVTGNALADRLAQIGGDTTLTRLGTAHDVLHGHRGASTT
jgi:2-amino-4-hydroxy-6-hydroxymethyldihydropteridine diphosphokinase